MNFTEYLHISLDGVFTNSLFMGLVLGILVQDIRNHIGFEKWVKGKSLEWNLLKALLYLFSYVVAVPVGLMALTIIIGFLWLLSFIAG